MSGFNMITLYVDDCITISKTENKADIIFLEIDGHEYQMTDEITMDEYLRTLVTHNKHGTCMMLQPQIFNSMMKSVPSIIDVRRGTTPALKQSL